MTEVALGSPDVKDQARWFVDHNVPVVPLKGKTPISKNGVKDAKLSTDGITTGYGVALGKGLIGIDFDIYDGATGIQAFSPTRSWTSGSGKGYGFLYKVPEELSNYTFKIPGMLGITVRGCGSYLVGPGSIHPGNPKHGIKPGGIYKLEDDLEIADAPEFIIEFIKQRATQPTGIDVSIGNYLEPTWLYKDKRWMEKFNTSVINDRSAQTYDIAAYSAERGANNEELAWTIAHFKPAINKGHLDKEIPRVIEKIREKHKHPDLACDEDQCPNTPEWMKKELEVFDFWTARPEFVYIKQAAQNRQVAPKAVVIAVLCRLATAIPTEIVIPPVIGKKASLNFFACFVGESGGGKGTSTGLAEELFDFRQTGIKFNPTTPGSGEGVVSSYLQAGNTGWKQKYESCLINFDEIDNLKAGSERSGSTLSSTLRQGFMGEVLGGTYSKTVKQLEPHSYRMAFQLSAQPLRSGWLLEDSHGGLPQRFVFVSTTDPECPHPDDLPEFPASIKWTVPLEIAELKNKKDEANKPNPILGPLDTPTEIIKQYINVPIDPAIIKEIQLSRYNALKSGKTGNEGHTDLVRLKVAILLAFLNGRFNVTQEDWRLSYIITGWSRDAITDIRDALNKEKFKEQMARTTAAGDKAIYVEKRLENEAIDRVANRILKLVESGIIKVKGRGQIRQKLARDGKYQDEAVEFLVKEGKIKYDEEKDEISLNKK